MEITPVNNATITAINILVVNDMTYFIFFFVKKTAVIATPNAVDLMILQRFRLYIPCIFGLKLSSLNA